VPMPREQHNWHKSWTGEACPSVEEDDMAKAVSAVKLG
jgi:hypothetical protein